MLASAAGGTSYWILKYKPAAGGVSFSMPVVSSDNTDEGSMFWLTDNYITEIDKDGNVLNSVLTTAGVRGSLEIDVSGNVYIGQPNPSAQPSIVKFNSNLVFQSSGVYSLAGSTAGFSPGAFAVYGDDLYYSTSFNDFTPSQRAAALRVDGATLSALGSAYSHGGTSGESTRALAVDSLGNVFAHSNFRSGSGSDQAQLHKLSTDLAISSFSQVLNTTSIGQDVAFDSAGNIYVCGKSENGYPNFKDNYVAKFNSAGVNQWVKCLELAGDANVSGFSGGDGTLETVSVGANSFGVYTVTFGFSNVVSGRNDINITKWDASTGAFVESYGISCLTTAPGWKDPSSRTNTHCMVTEDSVYITAKDQSNFPYTLKLPLEGAGSIYGSYTLDGVSFTIGPNGATEGSHNMSWSSGATTSVSRGISTASQSVSASSASFSTQFTLL
jgi:hypothetical protein